MKKHTNRVAFYIPSLYKGGSERVLISLANLFIQNGFYVELVTDFEVEKEYDVPEEINRVILIDTKTEKFTALKAISRFRSFCIKNRIHYVISFLNIYHAILATTLLPTKCVVSIRNDPKMTYMSLLTKIKNRVLLPFADGIVFQTSDARDCFSYLSRKKTTIIENPIKEEFFDYKYQNIPNKIISVGRLTEQKNHQILIEAFADIIEECKDTTLEIFGDGELKQKLYKLICDLRLECRVFLKGQTSNVAKELSNSTVFVLPSLFEGMPNALMEAMAVGLPCVATDCPVGGSKMLLSDQCGILIINNDKESLKKAVLSLLKNESLRRQYSENARIKALKFKGNDIFLKWEALLEKLG